MPVPSIDPFNNNEQPRLATVTVSGERRVAVAIDGVVVDLAAALPDAPTTVVALIAAWDAWSERIAALDASAPTCRFDAFAPPVDAGKVICVGANYYDHVAEMAGPAGLAITDDPFPFGFLKPGTALAGHDEPVYLPSWAHKVDWEAELALVIGPPVADDADPLDAVFGYTITNDLSARDFLPFPHALGLDALVSKGFDGAAPIGPWITPAAAVADPADLPVRLTVNGEVMQDSSTAQLIFGLREIVGHYRRVMTLRPGDVIATGTPAGVGAGRRPPRFLAPGDVVEVTIGDLGTLRTPIAAAAAGAPTLTIEHKNEVRT